MTEGVVEKWVQEAAKEIVAQHIDGAYTSKAHQRQSEKIDREEIAEIISRCYSGRETPATPHTEHCLDKTKRL